jgi:tripartite-type tricarboxylate transporter receptor subunit TctC
MNRRHILKGLGAASALATLPLGRLRAQGASLGQSWPARTVTMIVPFPPGGQADLAARPIANALEKILGQPCVVENRGGGGGSIGNAAAARAAPDGYTLLMSLSSLVVLPAADKIMGRTPAYEASQLAPIARVLADPTLLAVPSGAPWKTLAELIDDAKKRPGVIPYGSSGTYGTLHVSMEMFAHAAGAKLLHVPFQGAGPAVKALLGGEVQALASAPGVLKPHVDAGTVRVLANWGGERIPSFPDLPTFKELGFPDVEFYIWAGLFAPTGVPADVTKRLGEAMKQAMGQPEVIKAYESAGSPPAYLDAEAFKAFIEKDGARLIAAVQKIGKVE